MASMMKIFAAAVFLGMLACGGGQKRGSGGPEGPGGSDEVGEGSTGGDDMVPPERMDEIKSELDRKRSIVARCLTDAIAAGQAPKNARSHVTIAFVISPAGKAEQIKVIEGSLESPMVQECVIGHVSKIDFGALPKPLDWSYTYQFEAF